MLTTGQLEPFFPDLSDPRIASTLALVHSRFSTNTFPSWSLAHPYRLDRPQRRDQHRARQPQLDARARGSAELGPDPRGHPPDPADVHRGRQRLGELRRGRRAAAHGRAQPAACGAHDDPGGMGEQRRHGSGAPGLLPVPRQPHGAVGRAGERQLHRRLGHRRGAGPQRPAPGTLLGDRRRAGRPRLRGRRPGHRPGHGGAQGAAAARTDVPGRHRRRAHHRGRRDQVPARGRGPVRRLAAGRPRAPRGADRARARRAHREVRGAPPADLRLHRGGAADPAHPDGQERHGGARLDGHRHPDRRAVGPAAAALRLLHPALRPGDQPTAGRDPRGDRDLPGQSHRPGGQPAGRQRRALPAGPAAVPGDRQRRVGQARPDQRRRRRTRVLRGAGQRPVPGRRRWSRPEQASGRDLRRGRPAHRRGQEVHRALRPGLGPGPRPDPVAAALLGGPPPPGAAPDPHPGDAAGGGR